MATYAPGQKPFAGYVQPSSRLESRDRGGSQVQPQAQPPGGATSATAIDPQNSLRSKQLKYNPVNAQAKFNPVDFQGTDMSMFTPQSMGGEQNVFNQQAAQGSGGRRLDFDIDPQSVMDNAMAAFQGQLPSMNIDFQDQSDQLAKQTAAMGRTGSGLFNRDTGYISDRARAARESLLSNMGFAASQSDQSADLQAQITRQNLLNSQEGRMSQASIANAGMQNQAQLAQAANAMNALMQNQSLGSQMGQFNALQDFGAQQYNIGNEIGQNQFGAQFDVGQQQYQNQLAQQAQQDMYNQMQLFGQGFQGDPANAQIQAGYGTGNVANMYGNQAGQANQGIQGGTDALLQLLMSGGGGGGAAPPATNTAGSWQPGIQPGAVNQFMRG